MARDFNKKGVKGSFDSLAMEKVTKCVVQFYHVPTGNSVSFKSYIKDFSDKYTQKWNQEAVFGRMDDHQVYQSTTRQITFSLTVLAEDIEEAILNTKKASLLARMQYPVYGSSGINNATSLQSSPLIKIKFLNWLQDSDSPSTLGSVENNGLTGVMAGFEFTPKMDQGVFHDTNGSIYPQEMSFSVQFTVLHTAELGWGPRSNIRSSKFPYGSNVAAVPGSRPARPKPKTSSTPQISEAKSKKMLDYSTGPYTDATTGEEVYGQSLLPPEKDYSSPDDG